MTIRMLCIGTSLTNGDTWPDQLAALLQPLVPTRPIEVVNRGIGGADSAIGLRNVQEFVACDASLVMIEYATNDAHTARNIEPAGAVANTRAIIDAMRTVNPSLITVLTVMNEAVSTSIDPIKLSRVHNAYRNMGLTDPRIALTIDLAPHFGRMATPTYDGVHPTQEAWGVVVPVMARALRPVIRYAPMRAPITPLPSEEWVSVK